MPVSGAWAARVEMAVWREVEGKAVLAMCVVTELSRVAKHVTTPM